MTVNYPCLIICRRSYAVTGQLRSRLQSSVDDMIASLQNEISEEKVKLAQVQEEVVKIRKEIKEHAERYGRLSNFLVCFSRIKTLH